MNIEDLDKLEFICIKIATGKADPNTDFNIYTKLRKELLGDSTLSPLVHWTIKDSFDPMDYYNCLQSKFKTYRERREAIVNEFAPLIKKARETTRLFLAPEMSKQIEGVNSTYLKENWQKIIDRAPSDSSGCITSARGLIESTLKFILNESGEELGKNNQMSDLLKRVKDKLFPNFPNEPEEIQKIFYSVSLVVDKIKDLRNAYGDAHGHIDKEGRLDTLSATFIANMSMSICSFLLEAFELYKNQANVLAL
jgi:hypothetical protein